MYIDLILNPVVVLELVGWDANRGPDSLTGGS